MHRRGADDEHADRHRRWPGNRWKRTRTERPEKGAQGKTSNRILDPPLALALRRAWVIQQETRVEGHAKKACADQMAREESTRTAMGVGLRDVLGFHAWKEGDSEDERIEQKQRDGQRK